MLGCVVSYMQLLSRLRSRRWLAAFERHSVMIKGGYDMARCCKSSLETTAAIRAGHQCLVFVFLVLPLVEILDGLSTGWQGHVYNL